MAQITLLEKRLDDLNQQIVSKKEVAGITILLLKDEHILYNKAFGYADIVKKEALQTNHIFRIASQTKAITSVAAMMLWEEGKFLLDDPISKYIPAFKNTKVLDKFDPSDNSYTTVNTHREISIRDLLRHTSGIAYPSITDDERIQKIYEQAGVLSQIGSKAELKDQVLRIAKQPLLHQPGEAFTYGLNTDILGYLVALLSGLTLDEFFRERLFEPLEMKDSYFTIPPSKSDRLVSIWEKTAIGIENTSGTIYGDSEINYPLDSDTVLSGGAGLSSTTADYARFLHMLLNQGTYKGKRFLSPNTITMMTTNQLQENAIQTGDVDFRFGLGFSLVTAANKFMHSTPEGSFYWGGAFNTHYWVDPKSKIIGLVYTQQYLPTSYWDLGTLIKNIVYASL